MDERTKTIDRIVRNFAPHTPGCWAAVAAAYDAAVAAERERCAKIVDMPPGTEAWEVIGGEEGLTMLRELAALIRSGGQP